MDSAQNKFTAVAAGTRASSSKHPACVKEQTPCTVRPHSVCFKVETDGRRTQRGDSPQMAALAALPLPPPKTPEAKGQFIVVKSEVQTRHDVFSRHISRSGTVVESTRMTRFSRTPLLSRHLPSPLPMPYRPASGADQIGGATTTLLRLPLRLPLPMPLLLPLAGSSPFPFLMPLLCSPTL
ncbi:unnamed protein product [Pylaiella littoralis]